MQAKGRVPEFLDMRVPGSLAMKEVVSRGVICREDMERVPRSLAFRP